MPFFVNVTQDEFAEQFEGSPRAYHLQQGIYALSYINYANLMRYLLI